MARASGWPAPLVLVLSPLPQAGDDVGEVGDRHGGGAGSHGFRGAVGCAAGEGGDRGESDDEPERRNGHCGARPTGSVTPGCTAGRRGAISCAAMVTTATATI